MKKVLLIVLVVSISLQTSTADDIIDMIKNRGYPAESHFIKTKDDYILCVYRIPCKTCLDSNSFGHTPVMLFVHGILASAPSFLLPTDYAAGYYFHNAGYDIWLANVRGTTYSRNHTTLNPDKPEFWNFSWNEIGVFDIPAIIDYILAYTNQSQLIYVGHSQGVASIFVTLTELPEYNEKLAMVHAMTPPIIFKYNHPAYPTRKMQNIQYMEDWALSKGNYELLPFRSIFPKLLQLCDTPGISAFCKTVRFDIFGPGDEQNYDRMLVDLSNHIPSGAGYRQFMHFGQMSLTGIFQKFDYGEKKNIKVYGTSTPPEYNFSNINTKMHLIYGSNDWLVPKKNIPILVEKLRSNVIASSEFIGFNHIDFTYAKNIKLVQNKILDVMKKYLP